MSFFAARRNGKSSTATTTATAVQTVKKPVVVAAAGSSSTSKVGSNAQTSATSNSASTTTTTTNTKLVTVTRRVSKEDRPVSLKERQREGKLKREAEEEQLRRRAALAAQRQAEAQETAERRRKALAKGKGRAADLPAKKFTVESSTSSEEDDDNEDDSGELGTPFNERRQPLRVLREDVAAPIDDLREFDVITGTQLVENNRKAYTQYFDDIPEASIARVEYPGDYASEAFLLLRPAARDQEEYHPIRDIISTIRTICDYFLTPEQALEHFKHVQHSSSSALGSDFDFLRAAAPSITRDTTPISETGTPEPGSTTAPATPALGHKEPLIRLLEKAFRRKNGTLFLSALEWYNSVIVSLRESGKLRENIINMGKTTGVPEAVWTKITGQCYERTVGPRIDELKKYEAFSDNTYGELLPSFVAHIANLTGLKEGSVLVDMGSGVGNCVVQASLATGCKSYGFENQPQAADIAAAQLKELNARCRLWGLRSGSCETHDADFLAAPALVSPAFREADVILVNNYVFSASTNESLSLMFLDLKDGAKIVSLKPFVHASGGTEITARNAYSPESILVQSKPLVYARNSVSWSAEDGTFYIATVNRDRLRRYLESQGQMLES